MARPSYLRQVAGVIPPGIPTLQPPFVPYGASYPAGTADTGRPAALPAATGKRATRRVEPTSESAPEPKASETKPPASRAAEAGSEPRLMEPENGPAPVAAAEKTELRSPNPEDRETNVAPARIARTVETDAPAPDLEPPAESRGLPERTVTPRARPTEVAIETEWSAARVADLEPQLARSWQLAWREQPVGSVHIGTIEVHVDAPAKPVQSQPPPRPAAPGPPAAPSSRLSRGYVSPFGLRQG
jgi:hypothetical protein